jgi:CNT family concentrative nucleoside transporter
MKTSAALSPRAYTIASYSLCGFANLGSVGIQIGVLGALAPSRGKIIARLAVSAMICGFLSTLQTAGIAYVVSCFFPAGCCSRLIAVVCLFEDIL